MNNWWQNVSSGEYTPLSFSMPFFPINEAEHGNCCPPGQQQYFSPPIQQVQLQDNHVTSTTNFYVRRKRTHTQSENSEVLSARQELDLKRFFDQHLGYMSEPECTRIASVLRLTTTQVKRWFKNRRIQNETKRMMFNLPKPPSPPLDVIAVQAPMEPASCPSVEVRAADDDLGIATPQHHLPLLSEWRSTDFMDENLFKKHSV